ncbi:MAG: methylaspartate mutase subunit E, partial [Clostridia bacterium]|nr:methylaspartate mutase subunit E [Clostridia bacterium]
MLEIKNRKLTRDAFEWQRKIVLGQWTTGKDVTFDEAVKYQEAIPQEKRFSAKLLKAKNENRTLIQPRAGVPLIENHIKLMQYLQNEGEADLLPTTIDSYTRLNRYEEA